MNNRILAVSLEDRSLDPMSAEVWITVRPDYMTQATEVRGRLMGPNCPYSSTVEIAYPLAPLKQPQQQPGTIRCRAVIPEASLWDVQSPFLYAGPVELWQDGQRADRVTVQHGLRRIHLGLRGLLLNGKPLTLSGRAVERLTEDDALALRREGCNLLLVRGGREDVWDMADRFGFLVLGEQPHAGHPSCLGWLSGEKASIQGMEISMSREEGVLVLRGETELARVIL